METIPTIEELKRFDTSHDLILSITPNEEIIQFNKESERFTGYLRDEVLHKKLSDLLIPTESTKQWKYLLFSIKQNLWIDNYVLPIKTKDNQIHMVTWTGFLVKTENGTVKDICIFGKPLKTESMEKPTIPLPEPAPEPKKPEMPAEIQKQVPSPPSETIPEQHTKEPVIPPDVQKQVSLPPSETIPEQHAKEPVIPPETQKYMSSAATETIPKRHSEEHPIKHGVNKIMFAREKKITEKYTHTTEPEKPIHPVTSEKSNISEVTIEKQNDQTTQKLDLIHQSLSQLLEKYDLVSNRLEELEKKDRVEKNQHKHLDAAQQPSKEDAGLLTKNQKTVTPETLDDDQQQPEETEHSFFSDPFGFKRQHNELDLKKQRLDIHMKQLESFETRLMKEKDIFHARVEEFSRWQEKLMALESEIEKRRQELMEQENFVIEKRTLPPVTEGTDRTSSVIQQSIGSDVPHCTDETLDKIPQSAAIIQRGILKQINTPFLELLGYSMDEIVEKSYFDFIALEGLADVEKYYLDRLKGDSVSMYRTVFSTKENVKVPVEVSIKQTIYNGEKAEIAIITCVDSRNTTAY